MAKPKPEPARASRPSRSRPKSSAEVTAKPHKRAPKTAEPLVDAAPKVKRPKLESGRFTMPKADFERVAALKARALNLGRPTKKNELLRAGLSCLSDLADESLLEALGRLESAALPE